MHTATLIANPADANLTGEIVRHTADLLGGDHLVWLAEGIACDIELSGRPETTEALWSDLQRQRIDLVVQPSEGRAKRLLLADMDSTMIQQECIDELAYVAGVGERVARITARAMNGELDFEAALRERVALLAGLDEAVIQQVLDTRITLMPGGPELVATMRANGAYTVLVSGGFVDFTQPIAARLGFDENRANRLLRSGGKLTGEPATPILGRDAKVQALMETAARLGLSPQDAIAVGDGANDLGMLKLAGSGVALHAKPIVAAECSVRLNFADLSGLLYVQGYSAGDFVEPES